MSKYPFMTVFHCRLLMSALGVIGILRTASCLGLIVYSYCVSPPPSDELPPEEAPPWSVPLPPLGVVPEPLPPVEEPLPPVSLPPPSPDGLLVSLVLVLVAKSMRLMVVSRFLVFNSPVARALRRRPAMFFATLKSSLVSAPSFTMRPRLKMAMSANFTFLPSNRSSLVQVAASVNMPRMAPFE